jgi:hypothetical protein
MVVLIRYLTQGPYPWFRPKAPLKPSVRRERALGYGPFVTNQWKRRSFQDFPPEPAQYRYPKTKSAAASGTFTLIQCLKNTDEPVRVPADNILAGVWLERFTRIERTPPRGPEGCQKPGLFPFVFSLNDLALTFT